MSEAKIADTKPVAVDLEQGKTYFYCTCGHSANQPFCDGSHSSTDFSPLQFVAERTGTHFLCACKQSKRKPHCDGSHSKL